VSERREIESAGLSIEPVVDAALQEAAVEAKRVRLVEDEMRTDRQPTGDLFANQLQFRADR
jgi:hypothetical protein